MTPLELYNFLASAFPQHVVDSVCCVETMCKKNGYCSYKQHYPVLDFDEIKNEHYNGKNIATPASVDAICIGNKQKYICFVELKGWGNFIAHISKKKRTVEETAAGYNLDGKLFDSQELCRQLTSNPDLFAHMPTIFLLVTDIDVESNGIESFADNMFTLAGTSSDVYSQCLTEARKTLDSEIHIDRDYVFCKNFYEYVADL